MLQRAYRIKLIATVCLSAFATTALAGKDSNLPLSKQASFVEAYSPAEVTIKATGLGRKDKGALVDLKKAAVYFVLFLGTDPVLNSPEAKRAFEDVAETFFEPENVMNYIAWEANKVESSVQTRLANKKKGRKITKMVRVNKKRIIDDLVAREVVASRAELAEAVGLPFVMVIPETPAGQTPLQVFDADALARHGAAVIESYLTSRKYDVVVPRASEQINNLNAMQAEIKGAEEDIGYQLALALGSDVYIVFSPAVDGGKATAIVKAYETTTARLLGTETGYSENRPGTPAEALVEEAINDAIDKVLSRITSYWREDVKNGSQYRLVFQMTGDFDIDEAEEIQFEISDLFDEAFSRSKENIVTDKRMDYLVWATRDEFKKASKIYRYFKRELEDMATVRRITLNRKLLVLSVSEPE
jgi:hypothetical protein